jgi:hypothetical protein
VRACAGTPPPGTEVNGRATRVHDFLGLRLASARCARGAPTHVPSGALPAARAELDLSSLVRGRGFAEAKLGVRAAGDSSEAA